MYDLNLSCRTCTKERLEGTLHPLFNKEGLKIAVMLTEISGLKVTNDDNLPANICSLCLEKLKSASSYKTQCLETYKLFKSRIDYTYNVENTISGNSQYTDLDDKNGLIVKQEINTDSQNSNNPEDSTISFKEEDLWYEKSYSPEVLVSVMGTTPEPEDTISSKEKKKFQRKRTHICPICNKLFTYSHLRVHLRSHTKEKPHKCKDCGKEFSIKGNFQRHMKIHTGERPHKCKICGRGFIQSTTLYDHIRIHTNETPFTCNHCGKSFKQSSQLRCHIRVKHNPSYQSKMYKRNVTGNRYSKSLQTGEYACDQCNKIFSTKSILATHSLIHGEKTYLCSFCGKGFISKFGMQSHLKIHTGEKPYKCDSCEKSFAQIASLKTHKLIHTGERPYQCTICSKSFKQTNHLKYHQRVHNGEKPYKCSVCNKQFSLNGTLTVHMRTHTGETPYVCSICNKGFYDSSSMKKHKKKHILPNHSEDKSFDSSQ